MFNPIDAYPSAVVAVDTEHPSNEWHSAVPHTNTTSLTRLAPVVPITAPSVFVFLSQLLLLLYLTR